MISYNAILICTEVLLATFIFKALHPLLNLLPPLLDLLQGHAFK